MQAPCYLAQRTTGQAICPFCSGSYQHTSSCLCRLRSPFSPTSTRKRPPCSFPVTLSFFLHYLAHKTGNAKKSEFLRDEGRGILDCSHVSSSLTVCHHCWEHEVCHSMPVHPFGLLRRSGNTNERDIYKGSSRGGRNSGCPGRKREHASTQDSEGGMTVAERTEMTFLGLLLPQSLQEFSGDIKLSKSHTLWKSAPVPIKHPCFQFLDALL